MSRTRVVYGSVFLSVAVGVLVLLMGLKAKNDTPKVVKVAFVMPIHIEIGQDMLHAAELALAQHDGKAGDVRIEIVPYDVFNLDAEEEQRLEEGVLREIIADKSIVAVIGAPNSAAATYTIPLLNPVPLTLVSPTATWPGLTKAGFGAAEPGIYYPTGQRNFFRVIPSDDVQGLVAAHWMQSQGYQRIFVVTLDTAYSYGLAGIMQANADDLGLEVVGQEVYDPENATTEITEELISKVEASNADVLYYPVPGAMHGYNLLLALFERMPDIVVMGGDGLVAEELPEDAALPDQIYATNVVDAAYLDSAAAFVADYQAAYGKTPPPFALTTYEAMGVVLQAIEEADSPSRTAILESMHRLENYNGAMGVWQFDENGDTSLTTVGIMQLRAQKWEVIGVIE